MVIEMNKKWILGIGALLVILIGVIIFLAIQPKDDKIISINGTELLNKLDAKDTFILVFTQEGCSHCEEYVPILNRVLRENNLEAYELDLTKFRKEEEESVRNKINTLFNTSGTPTTIFIEEGEEKTTLNRLVGSSNYSNLVAKLKERGFIKE